VSARLGHRRIFGARRLAGKKIRVPALMARHCDAGTTFRIRPKAISPSYNCARFATRPERSGACRHRRSHIDVPGERGPIRDNGFDRTLAVVAVSLVLVGLALFWLTGFRDRISSDAAVTVLLAQHVLDTGTLLPRDWFYGNGDLWIVGPQLLAMPFVALWGATPLALACGNALGLILIFASTFALARAADARWPVAALAASLTVSLYSHFQREFVAMQLSYGWMSAKLMVLLGLAIVWLKLAEIPAKRLRASAALIAYALLLCIWTVENPLRPLVYLVLPFGIVLALRPSRTSVSTLVLALATLFALSVGALARHFLLERLLMVPGLDAFRFAPASEWPSHLQRIAAGARHLYGGDALGVPQFPLLERMLGWIRAASVLAVAVLVARSRTPPTGEGRWFRAPFEIGMIDFAIIASVLVVGSTMVDPVGDRYLIPAWHLVVVGLVVAARPLVQWRWIATVFVIAFALGGVLNAIDIQRAGSSRDSAGLARPPELDGALDALRGTGIARGFATHRYANAATVRSLGELQLCDVLLDTTPRPARWINATSCFDATSYANGFFLLLAADEKNATLATTLRATMGQPGDVIEVGDYSIWTYPAGTGDLAWLSR
jgi:hypothetical protein